MTSTVSIWMTVPEVADLLQVAERVVQGWIGEGNLPVVELGSGEGRRVRMTDLAEFVRLHVQDVRNAVA